MTVAEEVSLTSGSSTLNDVLVEAVNSWKIGKFCNINGKQVECVIDLRTDCSITLVIC